MTITPDTILEQINSLLKCLQLPRASYRHAIRPDEPINGELEIFGRIRPVECKANLTPSRLPYLCAVLKTQNGVLFSDYLTPTVTDYLRYQNIEFADQAGNMFFRDGKNIILIQNKTRTAIQKASYNQGRAWTPSGLKVLFLLLTEPGALNWNYREIAAYSGVSLGSVKYVMSDLLERQFIQKWEEQLRWGRYQKTIELWCSNYAEKLLTKISRKFYIGTVPDDLKRYPIAASGETAVARLRILKTNRTLLWQTGNINELIARCRWQPDTAGNIEIREAFWPDRRSLGDQVPYLLIYADLLAENDTRCLEAAQIIYERFLQEQ